MPSCVGCKWLFGQDQGYSNYTTENTSVRCALKRNPNLPADEPFDWNMKVDTDNWPATKDARCDDYAPGPYIQLDCDGEDPVESQTKDADVIEAINRERD